MKKIVLLIALAVISLQGRAQLTLDHTFSVENPNASGQVIVFNSNGEKIMMSDTGSGQVKLYNPDYSLWKTITVPTYAGYRMNIVFAVSDNLFNSDNLVELGVSYYNPTSFQYKSVIINESGTVIQDLGGTYAGAVHYINGVYKLFAFRFVGNGYIYDVYSLPGIMPCGHCGALGVESPVKNNDGAYISQPVPNPSSGTVTISYVLPSGVNSAVINFFNVAGKQVKSLPVNSSGHSVVVNTADLAAGDYFYDLNGTNFHVSGAGALVIK